MGLDYSGASPKSRVTQAELDYAQGRSSYQEMAKKVRAEGYVPGSAADVKRDYSNRRGRKR